MSSLLNVQLENALVAGISTVIGGGIVFNAYKFVRKIIDNTPPQKWRKVGELSDLWIYPVKSCGPIVLSDIDCGVLGAGRGHLRDRVFMVTRLCGETVTARTYPKMVRIMPRIENNILTVSASGMSDLVVDIEKLHLLSETIVVTLWKDTTECIDCGDEAAKWFSKAILGGDKGFRFAFYASSDPKPVIADRGYLFEQADDIDTGALHDEASYLLMNQGSFDDLNSMINKKVGALQYRPNFLIKGPAAWEEDKWKWVKIGKEAIFKSNQPCTRCVLTNIDPATGERNPQMEPLKTLKTFRLFKEVATSPVFGLHLGIRQNGRVRVGDSVYVAE